MGRLLIIQSLWIKVPTSIKLISRIKILKELKIRKNRINEVRKLNK